MRRRRRENRNDVLGPAGRRSAAHAARKLVGADTAAAQSQQLPVTFVLALLAASAALVVTFAACGRRSKYAPTEVEIPPLDPDEREDEDAALVAFVNLLFVKWV